MRSEQGEDEAWQPREGIASYLDRTSIRSEHRRRQGSEDRISDHISIGMEKEANTGEDEAGQQGDCIMFKQVFNKKRAQEEASSEERISHNI